CARSRSARHSPAVRGSRRVKAVRQAIRTATSPSGANGRMCTVRIVIGWVGAMVVLAGSIVAGVAIANATEFSASAFARDYLTSLADGRVDEVLALPGVDAEGLDQRMLDPLALDTFSWELVGDTEADGVHRVTVAFTSGSTSGRATLHIERVGTRLALFPEWGFA